MNIKAYHGTNQNITGQFKHGLDNKGVTSKYGYWFTDSVDEAKQYGKQSSNRMRTNAEDHDKLIEQYMKRIDLAERKGNWDLYDKLTEEMEAIEFGDYDKSYYVYTVSLSLENPFVYEVGDEYFDQETVIKHAIKKKYDSVIFKNISDSPYGGIGRTTQYVVFDPSDIKMVSKHKVDSDSITESFVGFVKSLDRGWNTSLIEAIVDGYNLIFESDSPSDIEYKEFVRKTDGMDILYHGGSNYELNDFMFFTDYHGHASEYGDYVNGIYTDLSSKSIMHFDDDVFNKMRSYYANHKLQDFLSLNAVKKIITSGILDENDIARSLKIIKSELPYSNISINPEYNDPVIPLMLEFAKKYGRNIISFWGSDYSDYGGAAEFVVYDVSIYKTLRDEWENKQNNAIDKTITESVDNIDSPELDKALSQDTFEDRVIMYLEKTGSDVFTVPTDNKLKELLASTMMKYITPDRIERVVKWTDEYEGMSVDELRAQSEQAKKDMRDEYMQMIQSKVELYKAAEAFIKSKDPSLTVDIPSMNSIIKDVLNIHNDEVDMNSCVLYVYKGNDKYDSIGLLVNPTDKTIEIFEENEESNQATISAVTALTKDPEEYVKVFSSQKTSVIGAIESTQTVPKEMFVSPDLGYAKGYLQEDRDIISFEIQYKYLNPHSQYDWQVNSNAPIRRFRYQ